MLRKIIYTTSNRQIIGQEFTHQYLLAIKSLGLLDTQEHGRIFVIC